MNKTTKQLSLLLAGLLLAGAASAGSVRSPSMLANTCAGCHGTDGASAGDIMPIIGGMEKEYMSTVLLEYKTGERDSTIMGRIAKGYSDNELKAIASAVVGGTSLMGGIGSIPGIFLGTLTIQIIENGLILMGAPAFGISAFIGAAIILFAVLNVSISRVTGR